MLFWFVIAKLIKSSFSNGTTICVSFSSYCVCFLQSRHRKNSRIYVFATDLFLSCLGKAGKAGVCHVGARHVETDQLIPARNQLTQAGVIEGGSFQVQMHQLAAAAGEVLRQHSRIHCLQYTQL
jgi:hypothetical protein